MWRLFNKVKIVNFKNLKLFLYQRLKIRQIKFKYYEDIDIKIPQILFF